MPLSKIHMAQLTSARIVGGTPSVYVTNEEIAFLLCLMCRDLDISTQDQLDCQGCLADLKSFYDTPIRLCRCAEPIDDQQIHDFIEAILTIDADNFAYLIALVSLHKQRRKFDAILQSQSLPDLETIAPRSLLELGTFPHETLASWLIWRKFLYDIDNRSAQTTGYLFEPILATAIGGVSYSASTSPVKRSGTGRGRQVDCIVGRDAYEFKMRVTIAASGQGRFAEELSYAQDCHASGYRPILLVLDPTPSTKLTELSAEYQRYGGLAFVGESAWEHLEEKAGATMATFLENYIQQPLTKVDNNYQQLQSIQLDYDPQQQVIALTVGDTTYQLRG